MLEIPAGQPDRRDSILSRAHEQNAKYCELLGHHYLPELALNGDYACGYCRAVKAMTPPLPNDRVIERA